MDDGLGATFTHLTHSYVRSWYGPVGCRVHADLSAVHSTKHKGRHCRWVVKTTLSFKVYPPAQRRLSLSPRSGGSPQRETFYLNTGRLIGKNEAISYSTKEEHSARHYGKTLWRVAKYALLMAEGHSRQGLLFTNAFIKHAWLLMLLHVDTDVHMIPVNVSKWVEEVVEVLYTDPLETIEQRLRNLKIRDSPASSKLALQRSAFGQNLSNLSLLSDLSRWAHSGHN